MLELNSESLESLSGTVEDSSDPSVAVRVITAVWQSTISTGIIRSHSITFTAVAFTRLHEQNNIKN